MNLPTWAELFPHGRDIFYEGNDPGGFCAEIKDRFGFDPCQDPQWGDGRWHEVVELRIADEPIEDLFGRTYRFHCPPEHLDAIYGSGRWPMGS